MQMFIVSECSKETRNQGRNNVLFEFDEKNLKEFGIICKKKQRNKHVL